MVKSQQEINYENALKAKKDAQEKLAQANEVLLNAKTDYGNSKTEFSKYKKISACGLIFYTSIDDNFDYSSQSQFQCIVIKNAFNNGTFNKGENAKIDYDKALGNLNTAENSLKTAKINYDSASSIAEAAYKDWLDWKKANMSAEELESFNELEAEQEGTELRLSAWKWAGIIGGAFVVALAAWYLWKKFKS